MGKVSVQIQHSGTLNGEVTLRRPSAGVFADAMEAAEVSDGKVKFTVLLNKLLPYCIDKHPFSPVKVSDAIRRIDYADYMALFNAMKEVAKVATPDAMGESNEPSNPTDSQETDGSEELSSTTSS